MADTHISDTSSSLPQDNDILPNFSGELYDDDRRGNESPSDCEHEQLSPRSSTPSTILTSFFIPKEGSKMTSVDSASPSETTPLLVPLISRIEDHGLRGSNASLSIFWNEVKTLAKYALPVFGFVYDSASVSQRTLSLKQMLQVRTCLSIVSLCPQ